MADSVPEFQYNRLGSFNPNENGEQSANDNKFPSWKITSCDSSHAIHIMRFIGIRFLIEMENRKA